MATYTSYLNLEKPTTSETFNLLKMNSNWDKIDAGVSALNSNLVHRRTTGAYTDQLLYGAYGFITTSGTKAVVYIPLVWNVTVQSVNVSKLLSRIRTISGTYLGGSNGADLSSYITSVSVSKSQGLLIVNLDNESGWNITNNTPIIGEVTLTYTVSNT